MSEYQEQAALIEWVAWAQGQCPALALLLAIPNGEKRDPATGAKLKAMGVRAGVPDLFLPVARAGYHGLWIELKAGRNGTDPAQDAWMAALQAQGYRVVVAVGWDAARAVLEDYLELAITRGAA